MSTAEDTKPSTPTSLVKDSLSGVAVVAALIYGLGYIARSTAISETHVGDLKVSRESAVACGATIVFAIGVGMAGLLLLRNKTLKKKHRFDWIYIVISLGYILATDVFSGQHPGWRSLLYLIGFLVFAVIAGMPDGLVLIRIRDHLQAGDARMLALNVLMLAINLLVQSVLFGSIFLARIAPSFGGLDGPLMALEMDAPKRVVVGRFTCEDDNWMVINKETGDGAAQYVRIPKTSIKTITPFGKK